MYFKCINDHLSSLSGNRPNIKKEKEPTHKQLPTITVHSTKTSSSNILSAAVNLHDKNIIITNTLD